jgi:hypothetical protein
MNAEFMRTKVRLCGNGIHKQGLKKTISVVYCRGVTALTVSVA